MAKGRTAFQRDIDDTLTENFNNVPEVRCFLLSRIAKLIRHLEESYGDDIRIFIKGGSSLNIMKNVVSGIEPSKWSDFDNQIIINPNLPVYRWYQIMSEVHGYLKEEYMPRFQQDWEAFLTCNRKELDGFQQQGLKLFKGKLIDNKIFDYPTLELTVNQGKGEDPRNLDGKKKASAPEETSEQESQEPSLEMKEVVKAPIPKESDVKVPVEPEQVVVEKQVLQMNLTLDKKTQSNMVFNSGMALLHPLNHFDNAMIIPEIGESILTVMEEQGLHPDEVFYNAYFPPAPMELDTTLIATENPYSSSILVNTSISKFILYRVVVRYKTYDFQVDGSPKLSAGKEYAFGPGQKMFDSRSIAKFRGELLDISIPRRDSYEAIQQWVQVKTMPLLYKPGEGHNAVWVNVPDWRYQLNENVLLILEVFGNMSGSPHKFYKRVMRGCNAVEAIHQSYISRFGEFNLGDLKTGMTSDNFIQAFDDLVKNKALAFLTPLIVDLYNVVQDDYLLKSIGPALVKFKALKSVDIEKLIGDDIAQTLQTNWKELEHKNPDSSSSDTYDAILIKEVKNKDKQHGDANYAKAQAMLGFMKLYEKVHEGFKVQLEFLDQPSSAKDISIVNGLRQEIEDLPFVDVCSFCGLLSSMIHMKSITGEGLFDYHFPFVELFVITDDKTPVQNMIQALNKLNPKYLADEYIPYNAKDVTALPSVQLYYPGFDLPIVIRMGEKLSPEAAFHGAKVFEQTELEITKKLRKLRLAISGTRKQLVHAFDQKESTSKQVPTRETLQEKLDEDRNLVNLTIDEANVNSYNKQLLLTFNHLSTAEFIGNDGVYRILLAPEAIKHMDLKIAHTASFFQMHWLDHHRTEYKTTVTTFPPKRTDIGSGGINIYSSLNTYKAPISYSSISTTNFSQPVVYANTTAAQAILDIGRDTSWSNIGGDIAPLLMSQMLGFPLEVASAASPEDVRQGRLRQVHRFDQLLAPDYRHTPFPPVQPLQLAGVPQTMTGPVPVMMTLVKIGNHYWVREANGNLRDMDRDGNCFYHAILTYFDNSPQTTTDNLRTALAAYAGGLDRIVEGNTTRLQYIIDNIGAIENSFRPVLGYQDVAIGDMAAVYRGLIRNLKGYLVDQLGNRVIAEDQIRAHEVLLDIDAVHDWTAQRLNLIAAARLFVQTGNRPLENTLPTDNELGLN
ncbi:hypothetical protein [Thalassomonas actiniarum]|uniref:Uncharacterized protein n=1 Tax=Thalassomonas actiniarum TaxID=485447 RepID=A0AAF0C2M3_9GAMM|nr:hypothetical protein [Thalassomonas actiniarum]WDD98078.1 hypothetical protein SG35_022770 [Thalassomonas actiniarum]